MTAQAYLRCVAFELRDLPWSTRRELLSDLRRHLDEVPAGTDLGERLGTPEQYAADLRAAAGLERRRGPIAFLRARRPRDVILSVVALTVIGLGIGAVAWIQSYQPLAFAGGSIEPQGVVQAPAGGSESVVFRESRPFQFGITVQNTGSFTVRVLDVALHPQPSGGWFGRTPLPGLPVSARLMMSRPLKFFAIHGPYTDFHPFDLKPGEVRLLYLRGIYANCRRWGGGVATLVDFPVRFRFLWRTTTVAIPLPEQLTIVFPKGYRCR